MGYFFRICFLSFCCLQLVPWASVLADVSIAKAVESFAPAGAVLKKKTLFLSKVEKNQLEEALGFKISSRMVPRIEVLLKGKLFAHAYLDTHMVRKLSQTLLIFVMPDQRVADIQVLNFQEPPEYSVPKRWLRLFKGYGQNNFAKKKNHVPARSGATMTSASVEKAVKKIIAITAMKQS